MATLRAPPLAIFPPPAVYAATFLVGMGLDRLVYWDMPWMRTAGAHRAGWVILVLGLLLGVFSAGLFAIRRTTVNPAGQPARLIATGVYGLSRNPMYVALTLVYAGAALVFGQFWALLLLVPPWAAMNGIVIPFEESRLRETFGQAYVDYCQRVPRWI